MASMLRLYQYTAGKNVRFGSLADICSAGRNVRFTHKADISPRHPNVSFGLIAALEPAVVIAAMGHDMAADPEWPPQRRLYDQG